MSAHIDRDQIAQFLREIDPNAKWFTFQTFTDREQKPDPDPLAMVFNISRVTRDLIDLYEQQHAGVWVTINDTLGNGRKAIAVTRIRAVWQEDDDNFQGEFPLEPSLVVETSPGHYHRYWLVAGEWPADEQGRKDFAGVMARMVAQYGSDNGAKDISRVLRVPGFLHRKHAEPHMVRIVGGDCCRYTRAEIIAAFPPLETTSARNGHGNGHAGDSEGHAELVSQLLIGANYHNALTSLAWRLVGAGMPAGQVVEHLRGLMRGIPNERRDERWHARVAEIPRIVSSAEEKRSSNGASEQTEKEVGVWPDPVPLPHSLLPVAPFDYDMLPNKVRPWVEDVADRMQCPPDFVAVSVVVGLGSVIGRKVTVRPKAADDWSVVPNMWGVCIGPPGVMKSPAQSDGLRPVRLLADKAREMWLLEKAEYDIRSAAARARTENAKKEAAKLPAKDKDAQIRDLFKPRQDDGEEPKLRRYMTTNASVEALGDLLRQNPNGVLIDRDEMLSLLDRLDEEGRADERGFFLSGANGDTPYTFDRIARGLNLHIPAVCISMIGGTQPARISQYLAHLRRGGRGNDGLIQRFGLMVWPDISPTWTNIDRKPDREARDAAFRAFEVLDTFDWRAIGGKRDFAGRAAVPSPVASGGGHAPKPPRMRWQTYRRLQQQYEELLGRWMVGVTAGTAQLLDRLRRGRKLT